MNSDGCFSRFIGRRSHGSGTELSVIGADWPGRRNCRTGNRTLAREKIVDVFGVVGGGDKLRE